MLVGVAVCHDFGHRVIFIAWFAVYAIEATVHAPSWEGVYSEIFKVLKPGGVVSTSYDDLCNILT
jgi:hypothetical protein